MEMVGIYSRPQLSAWLETLAAEATLIAPQDLGGALLYRPVTSSANLVWEFTRPVLPVKEVLFPPTERLLTIQVTGQGIDLGETLPEGCQVVFGVRPCEARGLRLLDALFLEQPPVDPYYARRRENTTLIGLACREMGASCFCASLGSGPDDPRDVDLMLTEIDGGYLLETITEKGLHLAKGLELEDTGPGRAGNHREGHGQTPAVFPIYARGGPIASTHAHSSIGTALVVPGLADWPAHFADDYWDQLGERCLSCRICAYVCPTCRCFDVRDEALESEAGTAAYERLRCWDSCVGPSYRRIAGGHNPRSKKGQRLRNRFFCKFYYYPQQHGLDAPACTGCGRCIDSCPVDIDIREVIRYLAG